MDCLLNFSLSTSLVRSRFLQIGSCLFFRGCRFWVPFTRLIEDCSVFLQLAHGNVEVLVRIKLRAKGIIPLLERTSQRASGRPSAEATDSKLNRSGTATHSPMK